MTSIIVFCSDLEAEDEEDHRWLRKAANRLWGPEGEKGWPENAEQLLTVEHSELLGLMPKWKVIKPGLIIYSTDGANPHAVTPLVQLYLQKFHRDWWWSMEWAEISETPLLNSFGGGAAFVTADHVAWHYTSHFVNNMIESFEVQHRY